MQGSLLEENINHVRDFINHVKEELAKLPIPFEVEYERLQRIACELAQEKEDDIREDNFIELLLNVRSPHSAWKDYIMERIEQNHVGLLKKYQGERYRCNSQLSGFYRIDSQYSNLLGWMECVRENALKLSPDKILTVQEDIEEFVLFIKNLGGKETFQKAQSKLNNINDKINSLLPADGTEQLSQEASLPGALISCIEKLNEKDRLLQENINHYEKIIQEWHSRLYELIVQYCTDDQYKELVGLFIAPREDWKEVKAASRFRSPNPGRLDNFNAHLIDDELVLASSGPLTELMVTSFINMLKEQQIEDVIALGDEYYPYWMKPMAGVVRVDCDEFRRCLKIPARTAELFYEPDFETTTNPLYAASDHCFFKYFLFGAQVRQIQVRDNGSLNFDNDGLELMVDLLESKKKIVIHCASGVGRTGQLRLILAAMRNNSIMEKVDQAFQGKVVDYAMVAKEIAHTLAKVRLIRYAVQSKEQLLGAVSQIIMLRYVQLLKQKDIKKRDRAEHIDGLRQQLGINESLTKLARAAEFTTSPVVEAMMRRGSSVSSLRRQAYQVR